MFDEIGWGKIVMDLLVEFKSQEVHCLSYLELDREWDVIIRGQTLV